MSLKAHPPTKEATLNLLLRTGQSSAARLANNLGISVQAMRRHLRSLEKEELIRSNTSSPGPGRPPNIWELTPKGRQTFNVNTKDFALNLLNSLDSTLSPEVFKQVLSNQTNKKEFIYKSRIGSGSCKSKLEQLIKLRREEGYFSELKKAPDSAGWQVIEYNCSIRQIAEAYPVFCDQELEMIRKIFPECKVDRRQWCIENDHYCGFLITPLI